DPQASPETSAERADMLVRVRRILEEELTPKQREALVLLGLQDIPMEEAAKRMKTNRNALYKLLHDARLRLNALRVYLFIASTAGNFINNVFQTIQLT
ncbi:MAG: RNA polymerase sigma factor, partial [Anaerolineales bacterium]